MQNKEFPKLRECPFCGGKARNYEGPHDGHAVCCDKCSAKIIGYGSKGAATRAWNRRVNNE
jgi:hypothetical protein